MEEYKVFSVRKNGQIVNRRYGVVHLEVWGDKKAVCFIENESLGEVLATKGNAAIHTVMEKPEETLAAVTIGTGKAIVKGAVEKITNTRLGRDRSGNPYGQVLSDTYKKYENRFKWNYPSVIIYLQDIVNIKKQDHELLLDVREGTQYALIDCAFSFSNAKVNKLYAELLTELGWK